MKLKLIIALLAVSIILFAGCTTSDPDPTNGDNDAVTAASLVEDAEVFEASIGSEGTWIVAILNDITSENELVIEGEFYNRDDASTELYRKIALYAQDADRNVTDRYTLVAPKLTVISPNTRIQSGTFVGDVYAESEGFTLTDATIEGNLYFATQEIMDSFVNEESEVTGEILVETE
ncbi:hypothetical protein [Alkalibacter saccharofermentans]|uniref:Polymer-forming protein n=1 Tax=Alkalibacter saccharofermentans DSM 14828 TaxID=1120975 RepID=A0A1M4UT85_9FIRM|nr:hypothetical protein [Alkalibacter saccharofermentans]SHE59878.1 hypothetical protein SAMN02746064_00817 [Alkalibacter saccharofermentans DSM 14828]